MTYMIPPLNALRAFEAAARHLSFKLAAHELHVTPGAVSQQVKALEERLGVALFERLHKQLMLTPAGAKYLRPLSAAFGNIAAATMVVKPRDTIGTIHLGMHATFNFEGFSSHLKRFRKTYPVGLRISQPAGLRELVEGKVDLLIDCGRHRHPGYKFDRLNPDLTHRSPEAYLVCPEGTAECPEIIAFRSWLLDSRGAVEQVSAPSAHPLRVITRRTG